MTTISLAEVSEHPEETVARAQGEPLLVQTDGQPVAVFMSLAQYDQLVEATIREHERTLAFWQREIEKGFEGPFEELTPELWEEICNADPGDLESESLAVPPGWRPRRAG
ncbi:MAG TPA: type II toxin-antitoxin system Phd/YefM family antitoxin [Thermoanaerobaculia bacterium]|nr:type II toxin-antitoxin system Phd/YefM family antitoxin [Thermoanaerobaculia bacterium]